MPFEITVAPSCQSSYLSYNFPILWNYTRPDIHVETSFTLSDSQVLQKSSDEFFSTIQKKYALYNNHSENYVLPLIKLMRFMTVETCVDIKHALTKPEGVIKRFFSSERGSEWIEDKTSLGKVVDLYKDYMQSATSLNVYMRHLDCGTLAEANMQAQELLENRLLKTRQLNIIKKASSKNSMWYMIANVIGAIDKAISSFFLPPRVLAAYTRSNGDSGNCDNTQPLAECLTTIFDRAVSMNTQHPLSSEAWRYLDNTQENIAEADERRYLDDTANAAREEANKEFEKQKALHNKERQAFLNAQESYQPGDGYYVHEDDSREPELSYQPDVRSFGKNNRKICVTVPSVVPGYLRWSIYKNREWLPDIGLDPVAEGGYNYKKGVGPTVQKQQATRCP